MVVEVMRVGMLDGYGVRFKEDRWFNPAIILKADATKSA